MVKERKSYTLPHFVFAQIAQIDIQMLIHNRNNCNNVQIGLPLYYCNDSMSFDKYHTRHQSITDKPSMARIFDQDEYSQQLKPSIDELEKLKLLDDCIISKILLVLRHNTNI